MKEQRARGPPPARERSVFAFSPAAALPPHIPDERLAAFVDVHMFDTHELGAGLAQMPESLDLGHIGPHQPGCSARKEPCASFGGVATLNSRQDGHGSDVGAGHLQRQGALDFVSWFGSFDKSQCAIHPNFRDAAAPQAGRLLKLQEGCIDERA